MTTITETIVASQDDGGVNKTYMYGYEDSCSFSHSSRTKLSIQFDWSGVSRRRETYYRFQTVNIPQGSTIVSAKLTFKVYSFSTQPPSGSTLDIYGNDTDDASRPTNCSTFASATRTSSYTRWTIPSLSVNASIETSDIADVIQEIVDRSGWTANNDMVLFVENPLPDDSYDSSDNWLLQFYARDQGATNAPELEIEYSSGTTVTPPAASVEVSATATARSSLALTPPAATFKTDAWLPSFVHGTKTTIRRGITSTWNIDKDYDSSFTETGCQTQGQNSSTGVAAGTGDEYQTDSLTAWWFYEVALPECYNVSNAFISCKMRTYPWSTSEWSTLSPNVTIKGEDAVDPTDSGLETCSGFDSRARTTNSVSWSPTQTSSDGSYEIRNTPDISSIVNELRNKTGWASGNNMVFFFEDPSPRPSSGYWEFYLLNDYSMGRAGRPDTFIEITFDGIVGEIQKTIGSTTNHGTSTPTSSSGSDPYTVGFNNAVTGASVGDRVSFIDYSSGGIEEYVYRIAAVNSSTNFDITFLSGGSQGNVSPYGNLYNELFDQAPGVFKTQYDYESPAAWAAELDTSEYCNGDDAIGVIMENEKFDEGVVFPASSSVALNSITLTAHPSVRHTGVANSGAGFKYTAQSSSGGGANLSQVLALQNVDNTTIEWIEFDGSGVTGASYCDNFVTDNGTGRTNNSVRNCVMHNLTLQGGGFAAYAIHLTTSNDPARDNETNAILNNIIYGVTSTSGSGGDAGGIYADAGKSANPIYVYNNTVHNITPRTTAYFARGINVTEHAIVKNNIVTDVTGSSTANCFTAIGSFNSSNDYNLSTDTTAPGSNSITSVTLNNVYASSSGTIDLHLKAGSPAVDTGVDLGSTPTNVNIDIDGRDRDALGDTWDIGADEFVLNGSIITPPAAAVVVAVPNPGVLIQTFVTPVVASFVADAAGATTVLGSLSYTPPSASFVAACPNPTVETFHPSVSITPAAAIVVTDASCRVGVDIDVTPTVATIVVEATYAGIGFTSVTVSPPVASFVAACPNPTASKDSFAYTPAAAAVIAEAVSPTVLTGSITATPTVASLVVAGVTPTTVLGSVTAAPSAASLIVSVENPTLVFGSSTIAPGVAAIELTATYAGVATSSITVISAASQVVLFGVDPTVQLGSLTFTGTAGIVVEAQSPTVTYSSVTMTPNNAEVLVESRYGGLIAGNVTVIPNPQARLNATALDPTVAFGSQVITPDVAAFVANATLAAAIEGNLNLSPEACIVEISAVSPTIDMGLDIAPPVAAAIYDVGSFTLLVGKLSAYVGYSFSGLIDYDVDGLIDYELSEPIDYETTTSPIDYSTDGLLDYEYDN